MFRCKGIFQNPPPLQGNTSFEHGDPLQMGRAVVGKRHLNIISSSRTTLVWLLRTLMALEGRRSKQGPLQA